MDLGFLDKSSGVTPLLVKLYDSHKLYGLAKDKQPLARAELTSAVSALLAMDLSPRESELIADILIGLMRQAEKDLKQALAEKLSLSDKVPLRLILQVSNDEIDVAAPVLRNSDVLGEMDLLYIIKSKGADYWREIAARKTLSDHVMNVLADTRDLDTAVTLAENSNIKLTGHALGILSDMAQNNEGLAHPLLHRDDVPDDIAAKLYRHVGEALKSYITTHYQIDGNVVSEAIDEIVIELEDVFDENKFMPTQSIIRSVERFQEKGLLTVKMMLGTLKRGQFQTFVAMLSKYTGLNAETMVSILRQPSGQGLAVICRAFEISKQDFISFYLLSNRIRNGNKMVDMKDISRAITYYERIEPSIARDIIQNSRGILN